MKTLLKRLILVAAALPLFVTLAPADDFAGSGVPVQYNSPADYEAASGHTLTYGEAPVLAALVASGRPAAGRRAPAERSDRHRAGPPDRRLRRHAGDPRRSRLDQRRVHAPVGPHHTGERRSAAAQRIRIVRAERGRLGVHHPPARRPALERWRDVRHRGHPFLVRPRRRRQGPQPARRRQPQGRRGDGHPERGRRRHLPVPVRRPLPESAQQHDALVPRLVPAGTLHGPVPPRRGRATRRRARPRKPASPPGWRIGRNT